MGRDSGDKQASAKYEKAYAAHYKTKNLEDAITLYQEIIKSHAATPEAGYARAQLLNIVGNVVPPEELLAAQVKLALGRLKKKS